MCFDNGCFSEVLLANVVLALVLCTIELRRAFVLEEIRVVFWRACRAQSYAIDFVGEACGWAMTMSCTMMAEHRLLERMLQAVVMLIV